MYNYEWTNHLKLSENFDVFPLQFANTKRIENNDCVFIFDEVGCGKTISAGLMALHYLYNNPESEVQIVTINSLVRPVPEKEYGQFLNDWYEKLPFSDFKMKSRIHICNNLIYGLQRVKKTGLLIVDEAHLFLEDSQRTSALKEIKAEKVIFLTATPMKHNPEDNLFRVDDLDQYTEMAKAIVGKCTVDLKQEVVGERPICTVFDINSPITRYFKDTVTALNYVDDKDQIDFEKKKVKRLIPEIWNYENDKTEGLIKHILDLKRQAPVNKLKNRYVIFTRYIGREQEDIYQKMILKHGDEFVSWRGGSDSSRLTVVRLNGSSEEKPTEFSHNGENNDLPDVIIINYQIAEQGLNLPGYNYVINYHIPGYPSSLEQRFGRIDRMGRSNASQYDEIHMAFLLSEDDIFSYHQDTNKVNFYNAVAIYIDNLITRIPSKNVILTKDILKRIKKNQGIIREYIDKIRFSLNTTDLDAAYNYLQERNQTGNFQEEKPDNELVTFCDDNEIDISDTDDKYKLKEAIEKELQRMREVTSSPVRDKTQEEKIDGILDKIGDKIFYFDQAEGLHTLEAIKGTADAPGCAERICRSEEYKEYLQEFNKQVKIPKLIEKYKEPYLNGLEKYFRKQFSSSEGIQNVVMTMYEFRELLEKEMENWKDIPADDKKLLCEHAKMVWQSLTFFKVIDIFRKKIYDCLWTEEGFSRERYSDNVPKMALENMYSEYHKSIKGEEQFLIDRDDTKKIYVTKWFQLFYYCADRCADEFMNFVYLYKKLCTDLDRKWKECNGKYVSCEILLESCYKKEVSFLEDIIKKIKKTKETNRYKDHYNIGLYDIFRTPKGNWRTPYRYAGSKHSYYSYHLPYHIWRLGSMEEAKKVDFFTYMIFNEISFGSDSRTCGIGRNRTISKNWWLDQFIPERCECSGEAGEAVKNAVKEMVERILDK